MFRRGRSSPPLLEFFASLLGLKTSSLPFILALSVPVSDLVDFLQGPDAIEIALDGGCFPVNLGEGESVMDVGRGRHGRGRGSLFRDLLEHV